MSGPHTIYKMDPTQFTAVMDLLTEIKNRLPDPIVLPTWPGNKGDSKLPEGHLVYTGDPVRPVPGEFVPVSSEKLKELSDAFARGERPDLLPTWPGNYGGVPTWPDNNSLFAGRLVCPGDTAEHAEACVPNKPDCVIGGVPIWHGGGPPITYTGDTAAPPEEGVQEPIAEQDMAEQLAPAKPKKKASVEG